MRSRVILLTALATAGWSQTALQVHRPLARESGPGRTETITLQATSGNFIHIVVRKQGVDVTVSVTSPTGTELLKVNSPNGAFGPEPISFLADQSGLYRITVAKARATTETGKYEIEWTDLRPPTPRDSQQIEAERLLAQAVVADLTGTKESYAQAIEFYEKSRTIWHTIEDQTEEGLCLHRIGRAYSHRGENQKAMEYYNQALPIRRAVGDLSGEANTLSNIGGVYRILGENQKALENLNQAVAIERAVGDRSNEAYTLNLIGGVYGNLGEMQKALACFTQVFPLSRDAGDHFGEAAALNNIGLVYRALGENQKALDYYEQALPVERAVGDRSGEANTLNNIGDVHRGRGEMQEALQYYEQALPIERAVADRSGEARTLVNIGVSHIGLGNYHEALGNLDQALSIRRAIVDRSGEAVALNQIGNAYRGLGENQKALDYYEQALPVERTLNDRSAEANTLINIGNGYGFHGEWQKAIGSFSKAISIKRVVGDHSGEGAALIGLGNVYRDLGETQKALESYSQALSINRAIGDHLGEARTLVDLGNVYYDLGDYRKALEHLNQALKIARAVADRPVEESTLNNIGNVRLALGEFQEALQFYNQALSIEFDGGDFSGEADTLNNLGSVYYNLGNRKKALDYYNQALPLLRAVGGRTSEVLTLNNLEKLFTPSYPDLAVLFGKQAVNVIQSLRRDNRTLDLQLRQSLKKSIEPAYRDLASLLINLSRFAEAEEVLNLLKDKEASDYIRRDSVADKLRPATLLPTEAAALKRYDEIVDQIVQLGQGKVELLAKRKQSALTPAEQAESQRLDADLAAANTVLNRYLDEQQKAFAPNSDAAKLAAKQVSDLKQAESVQSSLQKLGPNAVAIYTLTAADQYVAMLVTPGARKAYSTKISQSDLNQKLFAFRQALQNPASNPLPLAQELYKILLPEGLPADLAALEKSGPVTIMWSLDGTLRYVPIAALHDGYHYLVERFRNSLITPESLASLTDPNSADLHGAGFGVSQAHEGFSALPSVPEELRRIFPATVPGSIRLDADFSKDTFQSGLTASINPIVHIATHFDAEPGVAANSSLLLGDGTKLSLAEIGAGTRLFDGVDLLTLSACSTAFQTGTADGREVDSLGIIAQRLGAKGVIASLWNVSDQATATLMQTLYQNWKRSPANGKGEALRQAQAAMATGVLRPEASFQSARSITVPSAKQQAKDWSHPYYWAPFILIGNWK